MLQLMFWIDLIFWIKVSTEITLWSKWSLKKREELKGWFVVLCLNVCMCNLFQYLSRHDVVPREGGHFPARDGAANDHPDQAEDPEGHTHNLDSDRPHPGRAQEAALNSNEIHTKFVRNSNLEWNILFCSTDPLTCVCVREDFLLSLSLLVHWARCTQAFAGLCGLELRFRTKSCRDRPVAAGVSTQDRLSRSLTPSRSKNLLFLLF